MGEAFGIKAPEKKVIVIDLYVLTTFHCFLPSRVLLKILSSLMLPSLSMKTIEKDFFKMKQLKHNAVRFYIYFQCPGSHIFLMLGMCFYLLVISCYYI